MKVNSFFVLPNAPKELKPLEILANDLWYSWNWEVLQLFKQLDPIAWERCGSCPIKMLSSLNTEKLDEVKQDVKFMEELKFIFSRYENYVSAKNTWFSEHYPDTKGQIAYFCLEYGIHESLPIYSGGLGILAGDHLKSASDLGLPLVALGLFYREGYFKQYINADGLQQELFEEHNYYDLPIQQVYDGENPMILDFIIGYETIKVKVWLAKVGRVQLYLLDTNTKENSENNRDITRRLYTSDRSRRIQQEFLLGVGGVQLLEKLNVDAKVFHMNEGHSAFLALERVRLLMKKSKLSLNEAKEYVWATNLFTTHTPVIAGNEYFDSSLLAPFLQPYVDSLGISWDEFMSLGKVKSSDHEFCMTVLALKLSSQANGVAKLHGKVSRLMWQPLFGSIPNEDVPIDYVTNGVHARKWMSPELNLICKRYSISSMSLDPSLADFSLWDSVDKIPNDELWGIHKLRKNKLINYVRYHLRKHLKFRNLSQEEVENLDNVLDPEVLTIGFARRFATYKRGDLILKNIQRLFDLIQNSEKPIQIIMAGKAHPADSNGKQLIKNIFQFANKKEVGNRIVFLEDYDMLLARFLVQGVDVWLNTPVRPNEASGTSGMKAGMNGALNLSILDGWWAEAFHDEIGWAIGNGEEYTDLEYGYQVESDLLYRQLEKNVIPLYYDRNTKGVPEAWVRKMKNSIKYIGENFNTHRMVSDYMSKFYFNGLKFADLLTKDSYKPVKDLSEWKIEVNKYWDGVQLEELEKGNYKELKLNDNLEIKSRVFLNNLPEEMFSVEIYHGAINNLGVIEKGDFVIMQLDKVEKGFAYYHGKLQCGQGGQYGYTLRVLPSHSNLLSKKLISYVKWAI